MVQQREEESYSRDSESGRLELPTASFQDLEDLVLGRVSVLILVYDIRTVLPDFNEQSHRHLPFFNVDDACRGRVIE